MFRYIALLLMPLISVGCGDLTDKIGEMKLIVMISAVPIVPEGAEGTSSPKSIASTITAINWTNDETGETEDLWQADPESILILNRERILLEKDVSDDNYKNKSFSNFTVSLSTAITAQGKYQTVDLTLEPSETDGNTLDLVISEAFTIDEGKGRTVEVKCEWYHTVTSNDNTLSDDISNPNFTIEQSAN